jgi:hypothetical protein
MSANAPFAKNMGSAELNVNFLALLGCPWPFSSDFRNTQYVTSQVKKYANADPPIAPLTP